MSKTTNLEIPEDTVSVGGYTFGYCKVVTGTHPNFKEEIHLWVQNPEGEGTSVSPKTIDKFFSEVF